ncbi:MAG: sulfite exporter TauE/SafE family protein [Ruminococcus sp.]|jgi:uncharacterized membrane protein YfcA
MIGYIIIMAVSFGASVIGAICGIGGGVIIKPVLDAVGIIPVNTISFLSGCTVLSMSVISVGKNLCRGGAGDFDKKTGTLLAAGAAAGGILGKNLYQLILSGLSNTQRVGAVQAAVLLVITAGTLLYTLAREHITTKHVSNRAACVLIGMILGIMSAFLGIGGGPINLVVLFWFFSMSTKQAAQYSLYIIMFSQFASLFSTVVSGQIPDFSLSAIMLMVVCGVLGGLAGSAINKKIREKQVDRLFIGLMVVIILINIYNIFKYV